jgi:hypothetical protein
LGAIDRITGPKIFMKVTLVKIVTLTGLTGLLAGCVYPNGRPDNTGTGALMGGATGAAIGAAADRRNPAAGALIGGAAGLITGSLIGHSIDQENEARAQYYTPPPTYYVAAPAPQPLSVEDIKSMSRAGISDDSIIGRIYDTHTVYHLDSRAIIDLSNSGVSQRVISVMINTAGAVAAQPPPAPQVETVVTTPGSAYTWVSGEWVWNGAAWVWVSGRWVLAPYPHAIWVSARWEYGPHGWHRYPGYWR